MSTGLYQHWPIPRCHSWLILIMHRKLLLAISTDLVYVKEGVDGIKERINNLKVDMTNVKDGVKGLTDSAASQRSGKLSSDVFVLLLSITECHCSNYLLFPNTTRRTNAKDMRLALPTRFCIQTSGRPKAPRTRHWGVVSFRRHV